MVGVAFVELFADSLSTFFSYGVPVSYFRIGAVVVLLRILNDLFLNKLRSEELSRAYATTSLLKLSVTLGTTIYLVALEGLGVLGILYAYLVGEMLVFIILIPRMLTLMEFSFDFQILREAIRFGAPLIVGSVSGMLLNMSDRYILGLLQDTESVALYDLGFRVAGFLNMLLILPFNLALPSIASKKYLQPGDKRYFSKIMTYLTFVLIWAGLGLALFSSDLIKIFALHESFWPAADVVPLLILSYVFSGMRYVAVLGLFLTKNTKYVALLACGAAVVSISSNLILIPSFGYFGAAFSSAGSFLVFLLATKYFSDKFYQIPFEITKLWKIILIGAFFYVFSLSFSELQLLLGTLLRLLLLGLFPAVLYFWNFYEAVEVKAVRKILRIDR